jgi:hypothetical protein
LGLGIGFFEADLASFASFNHICATSLSSSASMLHNSTSRDINQKPRSGTPPLLMLLFFGFGVVFSLFFYLVVVGLASGVWLLTLSYLDRVFSVHIIQRHLFGCRFNGLLMGLVVGFALYTALCGPLKRIGLFFDLFPTHGLFLLHCNSQFEFVVGEPTPRLFELM